MSVDYICSQLVTMIHAPIRMIDRNGTIKMSYGSIEDREDPLICDSSFRMELLEKKQTCVPLIIQEGYQILYGVVTDENGNAFVAGPVCTGKAGRDVSRNLAEKHKINKEEAYRIGEVNRETFGAGILILNSLINHQEVTRYELWQRNGLKEESVAGSRKQISEELFDRQERAVAHNPYSQEVREMDSIRKGDCMMLEKSLSETYAGEVGKLAKNELRQAKNLAICVITLASRAAIEGGILPEPAFTMVDGYIQKIEDMESEMEIGALMRKAEYDFASQVWESKQKGAVNPLVERAKDYIFKNMHVKISVKNMAGELGIHADYLSDLFHRTEGITLQRYIMENRIHLSENLLRYTDYSAKEIGYYFAFQSQSHFGKVFKEVTGMTPGEYRKRFGTNLQ